MAEGFKVGSAYIDVDADAEAAIAKIIGQLKGAKRLIGSTADDIGQDIGRKLGAGIEKHLKATKGRLGVLGTEIGDTTGSRISTALDKQLRGAKGRLGQTAEGLGSTIGSRVSSALNKDLGGKLDASLGSKARQAGESIGSALGDGVDTAAAKTVKSSPKIKKALDSVAERTQTQFQAMVFAGAFAGMPAAAAVAATATVGALGIIPIALAAGAAKIQAGNEKVSASYTKLAQTATTVMTRASSVLVDGLVSGTDRLTRGMSKLEPAMTGAFRLASPAIDGVVTSVLTLTDEALPGIITGLTKTGTVMQGVVSLAQGAGRGVSDFFTNLSTGATSSVTNLGTLGRVLQDVLGFAGSFLANLTNGGTTILPMFANALSGIYSIILNLTSGGFSPLFAAATGFVTVVSGAIAVVQGLTGVLGDVLSPLAAVAGGILAVNLLTKGTLVSSFANQFVGLGTAIGNAAGAGGKFKTLMSGIGAAVFSPAGIAIAGLVVGLGLLGAAQQAAAARAAEHKARISDLSSALRDSNGTINDNVRALAAKSLSETTVAGTSKKVLQLAREQGVSLSDLTSAYLGNTTAQGRVNESLAQYGQNLYDASNGGANLTSAQRLQISENFALSEALKGTGTEYGKAVQNNKDLAAAAAGTAGALEATTPATAAAAQGAGKLASAYATLYSPMSSVEDKGNAIIAIMDRLAGRTPSYEEAIQGMNDIIRGMEESMATGIDKAKGWGEALLNADGTVSTFTENGSKLQDNLVGLQHGFANAGASIQTLVEGGMSYKDAAQQVTTVLETQRQRFIAYATDTVHGLGLSQTAAENLANTYGLMPSKVVAEVTDMGSAVNTQKDVDNLRAKLSGLPANTPVRVESITEEAKAKLLDLGYVVTTMPDGTTTISTNAPAVQGQIEGVADRMLRLQDRTVTLTLVEIHKAINYSESVGSVGGQATGGPQRWRMDPRKRATGGPTPYLSGMAGARLTGERGPEIDFPSRSSYVATAQQTQRMESDAKAGIRALQGITIPSPNPSAAPPIQLTVNVYPTPSMDTDALVEKITRKVGRILKGGN